MPASARRRVLLHALVVLGRAATAAAQVPAVQPPELRAGTLDATHSVDGRLDEPAWAAADLIDAFTQADPREGAPASARTTVRVLAGPKALVIGIDCEQPADVGVVSFSVRRDATLTQEDHVRIVLGPFMDGRSGYVFAVNPSGARYDGIINPGGESDNADWDGIWEAATSRRDGGWSVEMRIPVPDAQLQARSARVALQRAAPHPATARDRSLGVGRAPVPGHADEPRRAAHRSAGVRPRARAERASGRDERRRHPGAVG